MLRRHFLSASAGVLASSLLPRSQAADGASSKRLRVGVIGHTGRGNYGHGIDTLWLKLPQTEIVAVADPDPAGLASAQKRLTGSRPFADYTQMLDELRPDIVAVCPRHADQHHAMIVAALNHGARGIYVEKPFVRTPAEADDVIRLCKQNSVSLAIAHRNRYHPALPVAAELLASGELGVPLEIRARGKEDQRGGGLDLWVLGSHVLNLAAFFAGRPIACSATAFEKGRWAVSADVHEADEGLGLIVGDEIHARFEMESGIPVFFGSKKNAGDKTVNFGLQIVCTGGILDLRIDTEPLVQVLRGNPFKPRSDPRAWIPVSSAGLGKAEPIATIREQVAGHLRPAQDLIQAMETGKPTLCGPEDGLVTVEMIQAIFASHRMDGARIPLPLTNRGNALAISAG